MAQVRTRKRGKTWSYVFEAGLQSGKRKVIEKGGYPTQDAAYVAGVEAFTSWKHGDVGITSDRITLSDFAALWLNRVSKDIRSNTVSLYKTIVNVRLQPLIGGHSVQDITPAIVEQWLSNLYSAGLSKGYIKECRMVLKAMLDYAVHPCALIASNPCLYVRVPKNAPTGITKRSVISRAAYDDLMQMYPPGHDMRIPVAIFYHTGMRLGEVLGLTWDDIDFGDQTITINKQRIHYRGSERSGERFTEPKTEKSFRKIYVNKELFAELERERIRQKEMDTGVGVFVDEDGYCYTLSKELAGEGLQPANLVCLTAKGRMVHRDTLTKCLHNIGLNSHSFRHTQATRLAAANVPPVTAARRLGHATVDMTLNLYTHDTDALQKSAMELLGK